MYQAVAALMRTYANLANEMTEAGYSSQETVTIKAEVTQYTKIRDEVKVASGDYLDMKRYESAMRHLLDSYIRADESIVASKFEQLGLVELIVKNGIGALDGLPSGLKEPQAMAETIENNLRRTIIDENPVNPKYYNQMSELLDALILQRREQAINYQQYLEQIEQLASQVVQSSHSAQSAYPPSLDTAAKQSLYDNLGNDEALALRIDTVVRNTKKENWIGNRFKQREVAKAIREATAGYNINVDDILELVKNQREYQ